jgi:CHAT domain-containing protein/tetratricopeptide (TPR) repeat protein
MQSVSDAIPPICRRLQALAERDPRRAVPLAYRSLALLQAEDTIISAWAELTLGWALLYWERFVEARQHIAKAQALFVASACPIAILRCTFALRLADLHQFAHAHLIDEFATLAEQFIQVGSETDSLRAELYQALLMNLLGRLEEAEVIFDRIAATLEQDAVLDYARLVLGRGTAAITKSDYAHASELITQAERLFAGLHNPLERAKCWFQQAWITLRQEQLDLALAGYHRAGRVFARLDLPVRQALYHKAIGFVLARTGAYDQALYMSLRALRSFVVLRRTTDIAACQLNLGTIYFYTGHWDVAFAYYMRADALYISSGVVGDRIVVQRNLAMIHRLQGQVAESQALLNAVEAQAKAIGAQSEVAEAWAEQAALLADVGLHEAAFLRYQQARSLFLHIDNLLDAAECTVEQGWLVLRRGEIVQADALFRVAAPIVAPHPYYRWRAEYGLARCAEAQGDSISALKHYQAALATVSELRGRLVSESDSSALYIQAIQLHADALHMAAAHNANEDLLLFSERQRALALQRVLASPSGSLSTYEEQRLQSLRQEIVALLIDGASSDTAHAERLDEVLNDYGDLLVHDHYTMPFVSNMPIAMPAIDFDLVGLRVRLNQLYHTDWTVLVYTLTKDVLLIGTLTPLELLFEKIPYDETLKLQIWQATQPRYQLYTYQNLSYLQGLSSQQWEVLHALATRLLSAAVRARLHPEHRLLIVPSGPLHTLPWGALRLETEWLVEQTILHVLPSLTAWQALVARPTTPGLDALLVGCSTFREQAEVLPNVAAELAVVTERWPGPSEQLFEAQATRANIIARSMRGELMRCRLLHIASHAHLRSRHGRAAHVKLWDGNLWLTDVASLRLNGTIVVLSACDGAAADILPGEEVFSLSWAFLAAGASGVLASLWPVGDQWILHFIETFYTMLQHYADPGRALAYTQRELIEADQGTGHIWMGPVSWGSFVFIGSSLPLD